MSIRPLTRLALLLIYVYRWLLSPLLPASCRYHPSCSAYALEAVRRYGGVAGGWLACKRLLRCHPWGGGGIDPVPAVHPGHRHSCHRGA